MSSHIELPDLQDGYVELVRHVRANGHYSKPRDLSTIECENVTFTVEDTVDTLPTLVGRRPNLRIAAIEALQLIGGVSKPDLVASLSHFYAGLRESDGDYWGAYGKRVAGQYVHVWRKLQTDSDSRQAIITLWDPTLDNEEQRKDYPCTIAMGFRIRKGKLNMSVLMRSNDVWLGTCYDVFQFTQLQHTFARVLGIEVGTYAHTAWSLHIYERDLERADELHERDHNEQFVPTGVNVFPIARDLLSRDGGPVTDDFLKEHPNERWYRDLVVQQYDKMDQHGLQAKQT